MVLNERDNLVRQEQYRDLLREAEQYRLVNALATQPSPQPELEVLRRVADRVGVLLVRLGTSLMESEPDANLHSGERVQLE